MRKCTNLNIFIRKLKWCKETELETWKRAKRASQKKYKLRSEEIAEIY